MVGQSRYSLVCNESGGILDDIIVSRDLKNWTMVCNASNRAKRYTAHLCLTRFIARQPIERDDLVLPASYANFYIGNSCVLVPVFSDSNDARALQTLGSLFAPRRLIPIDCRELIWGLGAFHCLTQQQPAV